MEFYHYSLEMFVVLIADQFVRSNDGLLEQQKQKQDSQISQKNHISSDFKEKSAPQSQ